MNIPIVLVPVLLFGVWMGYFLRIRLVAGMAVSLCINIACAAALVLLNNPSADGTGFPLQPQHRLNGDQGPFYVVCAVIFANVGIGMLAKLYRAAILKKATTAECLPGAAGVRAWLSPLNVFSTLC